MHIPEKVVAFLQRHQGKSFCDACIERECRLPAAGQAARITATLELFPEFVRAKGQCSRCEQVNRLATRAV